MCMAQVKNKRKSKKLNGKKPVRRKSDAIQAQAQEEPVISVPAENVPIVFSWVTVDFIKSPVMEFYFTIAALASMGMIGWGIYDKNFLMVITFIMVVILIILALNEEPRKVAVRISERGIDLNSEHYDYNEFRSYKIVHEDGVLALMLKPRKSFTPFRSIYIVDQPVNDLEMFLGIYLEREEDEEKRGGEEEGKEKEE